MAVKQYDPGRVTVSFRGIVITGFAEGTFISAERSEDGFSKAVGADGLVTRVRMRDQSGTVTLTLMAAASANDLLSAAAFEDEQFGTGYGPLLIKDLLGNTLIEAPTAWIRKYPTVEFADENSSREWAFDCGQLLMQVGGSVL